MTPTVLMFDDPRERARQLACDIEQLASQALAHEHELIVTQLSTLAHRELPETCNHMRRVAHVSRIIARELRFDADFCNVLFLAAPLHDIGKIAIPNHILSKRGSLTPAEWTVMKTHTTIGYEVLKKSSFAALRMGADIAHSHHEHYDGRGYPQGLRGEWIPVAGRIVAVADEFDALLSVRSYKPAWPLADALTLIQGKRGRHFDPECVDAMRRCMDAIVDVRHTYSDIETAASTRRHAVGGRG